MLNRKVGVAATRFHALTGAPFGPEEATRMGLVHMPYDSLGCRRTCSTRVSTVEPIDRAMRAAA